MDGTSHPPALVAADIAEFTAETESTMAEYGGQLAVSVVLAFTKFGGAGFFRAPWRADPPEKLGLFVWEDGKSPPSQPTDILKPLAPPPINAKGLKFLKSTCDLERLRTGDALLEFSYGLTTQPAAVLHNLNLAFAAVVSAELAARMATKPLWGVLLPILTGSTGQALEPKLTKADGRFVEFEYRNGAPKIANGQAYAAILGTEKSGAFVDIDKLWINKIDGLPIQADDPIAAFPARFAEALDALSALDALVRWIPPNYWEKNVPWLRVACVSSLYERMHVGVRSLPTDLRAWSRRTPFVGLSKTPNEIGGYDGAATKKLVDAEGAFLREIKDIPNDKDSDEFKKFLSPAAREFLKEARNLSDPKRIMAAAMICAAKLQGAPGEPQHALAQEIKAILRNVGVEDAQFESLPDEALRTLPGLLRQDLLGTPIDSRRTGIGESIWSTLTSSVLNDTKTLREKAVSVILEYWRDVLFAGAAPQSSIGDYLKELAAQRCAPLLPDGTVSNAEMNEGLGAYPNEMTAKDEGIAFAVGELVPNSDPTKPNADEDPHVRLKGLAYYAKMTLPIAGKSHVSAPWRCVSRSGLSFCAGSETMPLLDSFVDTLAVTTRGGLRSAIVRTQGRDFDLRPAAEFDKTVDSVGAGLRFEKGRAAPMNGGPWPLAYGASYALRVACVTNAGLGPGEVAEDGAVFPAEQPKLDEPDGTTLKRWFLRTTKVQQPAIRYGDRSMANEVAIDPKDLLGVLPDLSPIERPLARELRAAADVDTAVVVPDQLKKLCLLITPPAVDFDTWRHYARGEVLLGPTNGLTQPTEAQVAKIEESYIEALKAPSEQKRSPFLPDPAIEKLVVKVTCRRAKKKWRREAPNGGDIEISARALWSYDGLEKDIHSLPVVPISFETGEKFNAVANGENMISIKAPKGAVISISVRGVVSNAVFASGTAKDSAKSRRFVPLMTFKDGKNLDDFDGDAATIATEFDVEIATDELPDQSKLWTALGVNMDGERLRGEVKGDGAFLYADRFKIYRQRWDWRGRDVQAEAVVPKAFAPNETPWYEFGGASGSDADDACWFGDRSSDDAVADTFIPRLKKLLSINGEVIVSTAELDRPPFPIERTLKYQYYRFRIEALSRYHGLRIDGKIVGSRMGASEASPYGWKRLFVAAKATVGERLPTPVIHAIVPMNKDVNSEGKLLTSLAASLSVWTDGDWYAPAGLARKLVCRVEVLDRPATENIPVLQHGSDPVRTGVAADVSTGGPERIGLWGGPIGLTFDLDAEAPQIANSAFRLSPVSDKVQAGDFLKVRFRAEYEPSATGLSVQQLDAAASEWSAPYWVQIPVQSDVVAIEEGKKAIFARVDNGIEIKLKKFLDLNDKKTKVEVEVYRKGTGQPAELYRRWDLRETNQSDFEIPNMVGRYLGPGIAIAFARLRGSGESASVGRVDKIVSKNSAGKFVLPDINPGRYAAYLLRYSIVTEGDKFPGDLVKEDLFRAGGVEDAKVIIESVSSPIAVEWRGE
jgi:hypothetical protein